MDGVGLHAWQHLHPPLQCHAEGWLDVGGGHALHWDTSGHPAGAPALFLHGGPGAGCTADDRRWFDPSRWRIVLFDQRGAGRSRPAGRLAHNTTAHLLLDIEALRVHLGIERWLLFGGSWGSTLALAYAQRHPDRVHALVLRGVFTATAAEQHWLHGEHGGAAAARPAAWQRLCGALGPRPGESVAAACARCMQSADAATRNDAAQAWLRWEQDLMEADDVGSATDAGDAAQAAQAETPASHHIGSALAAAAIATHYAQHGYFLDAAQLLAGAGRLRGIDGVIVQGGCDLVTPPAAAQALHALWPRSRLHLVATAGHASSDPAVARLLVTATDSLRPFPMTP